MSYLCAAWLRCRRCRCGGLFDLHMAAQRAERRGQRANDERRAARAPCEDHGRRPCMPVRRDGDMELRALHPMRIVWCAAWVVRSGSDPRCAVRWPLSLPICSSHAAADEAVQSMRRPPPPPTLSSAHTVRTRIRLLFLPFASVLRCHVVDVAIRVSVGQRINDRIGF